MKKNTLEKTIEFIFRYIWLLCAILIAIETISLFQSSTIMLKDFGKKVVDSVDNEIANRVDNIIRLLEGLSRDEIISDTTLSLEERASRLSPYVDSYDLYVIGIGDEACNVVDSVGKSGSLADREYMKRVYATGEAQIADPRLSEEGRTIYTVAVPIIKNNVVVGNLFGVAYFDDIEEILSRENYDVNNRFILFDSENTIVSKSNLQRAQGLKYLEISREGQLFGQKQEEVNRCLLENQAVDFWVYVEKTLTYVSCKNVENTNWMLMYRMNYFSVFSILLPGYIIKIILYFLLCIVVNLFGKRFIMKRLESVNYLLERIERLEKQVGRSDLTNEDGYERLVEITEKGLLDQLTGLATRSLFYNQFETKMKETEQSKAALFFLDLDDLKFINDNFGHEGGDKALKIMGEVLLQMQKQYDGIAGRYGGDEFLLLIEITDTNDVFQVANEILQLLPAELEFEAGKHTVCCSIGIALYPQDGATLEALLAKADYALYEAKRKGKNQVVIYQ